MTSKSQTILTPDQCRAARGFLDWSRGALAAASGVSVETIKNFETAEWSPKDKTISAIIRAFDVHGLKFIENGIHMEPVALSSPAKEPHAEAATP
jgi:ribosome-binding protein aMBF1 (putative translation factor)